MLISLDAVARDSLGPLRAQHWASEITPDEFCRRNDLLYAHPFGSDRIRTYGWEEKGKVISSLDLLELNATSGPAGLLASVVTHPDFLGRGFSTALIQGVLKQNPDTFFVLHSEISPAFYARFGFRRADVDWVKGPAEEDDAGVLESLSLPVFLDALGVVRDSLPTGTVTLKPDIAYWEWQEVRLRYFAELRGKSFPRETRFWVTHGGQRHLLAAAPNAVAGVAEGLWLSPECSPCRKVLGALAHEWGLRGWRCWGRPGEGSERLHPMVLAPGGGNWGDVQLAEWW